ncbi:MAG: NAD(P)-binding domain-containing protein [Pseudomonadales bacterium]
MQISKNEIQAAEHSQDDVVQVSNWLVRFDIALQSGSRAELESLFVADSHWRDLIALTWTVTPSDGRSAVVGKFLEIQPISKARGFKLDAVNPMPRRVTRAGEEVIESFFQFETATGRCRGLVRFRVAEPNAAWVISTSLRELKGFEWQTGRKRADGAAKRIFGGRSWAELREREQRYDDREPAVLIVGAGHNGLALAARLRLLGVDTLIVERLPNVGDVWRKRYSALALHNETDLNHLPYMPFPENWPRYLPKDMLGDWLESYAKAMECNVWTSTTFIGGEFDEDQGVWSARVRTADGAERNVHPRHLVFANGIVGEPKMPDTPGLCDFKGELLHAHGFKSGEAWKGKKAIILGVGNSAHDIAQDLHGHGAAVKMIQRGSITVLSLKSASINYSVYYNEGLSLDDCDLIVSTNTFPVLLRGYQLVTKRAQEIDAKLHEGLRARGFKLDAGPENGGHQMKVRQSHGGYYINVGCSDLIVNGDIGVIQYEDVERFVPNGVMLKGGQVEEADVVVTATGYHSPTDVIRDLLGRTIADKIGPVWGMDEGGEMSNMYKPTAQKNLWFTGHGFSQGRVWSHYVALQIKAREEGLVS